LVKVEVPEDLFGFLRAGRRLQYDAGVCEAGMVQLHRPENLRQVVFRAQTYGTPAARLDPHSGEAGTYAVPGVDLVASCDGDYEPEGLLVWFPSEQQYGVVDTDRDYVLLFGPDVRWADIATSPAEHINAQWGFPEIRRVPTSFLEPWHRYTWGG
jgi:hypothetical protein